MPHVGDQYEYKVIGFENIDGLNEIGQHGWMVVKLDGYVSSFGDNSALFMRKLTGYEL